MALSHPLPNALPNLVYPVPQADLLHPPRETLPTMYDLPSEDPEEPGLPDEFHDLQPHLLSATLRLSHCAADQIFTGTDMNLYYDIRHPLWHKRPDWFLVAGVPRLYDGTDLRLSYVIWQERVSPFVVVELLSPGTEQEDLGETQAQPDAPPPKWTVYEQILRIPYYVVFDRYCDRLRVFALESGRYEEQALQDSRFWMPKLLVGIGLWLGSYQGINRLWLRWYGEDGNWFPTEAEAERQRAETEHQRAEAERQRAEAERHRAETERHRAEAERHRAERMATKLRELGIDPDTL